MLGFISTPSDKETTAAVDG